jgi:hypothetical protein
MATFTYPNDTQFIYPVPSSGGGGGGADVDVEYRIISAGEATAKSLTLAAAPADSAEVVFGVEGGGVQILGLDFNVSGSTLTWNGLALDGIINAGDQVYILYPIT